MTALQPRVLVIDDDEVRLEACRRILQGAGFEVDVEPTGLRGRLRASQREGSGGPPNLHAEADARAYDVILVDVHLPDIDGLDLVAVREQRADVEMIVITGDASVNSAVKAVKLGAFDYLPKPFTPDELRGRVAAAVERIRERESNAAAARLDASPARAGERGPHVIGASRAMLDVHALVRRVAPTDATILIAGESGTGKELLATGIHAASRRRDRPMVSLDCSTLAPGLLESELFGHVKGSFTGAVVSKPGLFETADHGTLFLDEVSNRARSSRSVGRPIARRPRTVAADGGEALPAAARRRWEPSWPADHQPRCAPGRRRRLPPPAHPG